MKIKHVEELVGITRKNIRFYEEQGLLNPERAENGYREYHLEELEDQKEALSKMQEISRQIILQKVSMGIYFTINFNSIFDYDVPAELQKFPGRYFRSGAY